MKKLLLIIPVLLFLASCNESGGDGANISDLATSIDSTSYGFAYTVGKQLNQPGNPINTALMNQGFEDVANETAKSRQELMGTLQAYDMELNQRQGRPVTAEDPMKASVDSFSYALGAFYAYQFGEIGMEFNPAAICKGIDDVLQEGALMSEEEVAAQNKKFFEVVNQKSQAFQAEMATKNEAEGIAFLANNKNEEGVIETESGLQYKVIQEGSGASPTLEDEVVVHYEGRLIDGEVFDSSIKRGEPITFGVTGVIAGWTEALQLMKPGAKYQLYIPSNLAYGPRGSQSIAPNKTLIFDVELIAIVDKE